MMILRPNEYKYEQLVSAKTAETYSRSVVISSALEIRDLFIHHEILAPGKRASAPHYHSEIDEFLYLVKGNLIAVEDDTQIEISAGDSICFSANSKKLHYVENRAENDAEFLVVSKKISHSDVHF